MFNGRPRGRNSMNGGSCCICQSFFVAKLGSPLTYSGLSYTLSLPAFFTLTFSLSARISYKSNSISNHGTSDSMSRNPLTRASADICQTKESSLLRAFFFFFLFSPCIVQHVYHFFYARQHFHVCLAFSCTFLRCFFFLQRLDIYLALRIIVILKIGWSTAI